MAVRTKVKSKKKSEIQTIVDKIVRLFLDNPDHRFPAEEIAKKIFGSTSYKTCRIISSGYIPETRIELEEHHNATLDNKRKLGWKLCSGGLDTWKSAGKSEKLMSSHKNSYRRKVDTYDLNKFSELQKIFIQEEIEALPDIERRITTLKRIRNGIERIAIEEKQKKIEEKGTEQTIREETVK